MAPPDPLNLSFGWELVIPLEHFGQKDLGVRPDCGLMGQGRLDWVSTGISKGGEGRRFALAWLRYRYGCRRGNHIGVKARCWAGGGM